MRIIIVRHGEPNYEIDAVTEKGWKEAELASRKFRIINKISTIFMWVVAFRKRLLSSK